MVWISNYEPFVGLLKLKLVSLIPIIVIVTHAEALCFCPLLEFGEKCACLNTDVPAVNEQWFEFLDNTRKVVYLQHKDKLHGICCSSHLALASIKTKTIKFCPAANVEFFLDYVNGLTSDVFDMICGQSASGSQVCQEIEFKLATIQLPNGTERHITPIPALIEAINSL